MLSDGGGIISESGGDYFSELGGEIISESGGGLPRNLQAALAQAMNEQNFRRLGLTERLARQHCSVGCADRERLARSLGVFSIVLDATLNHSGLSCGGYSFRLDCESGEAGGPGQKATS
ncbi:hypothetical protein [Sinorhizobium meliloti]|uniref:hypothetical protein n=1 Tax=Rhizobium meliloti TaxID=382 RepID=UPI0018E813E6|nr:hypothetical protein [Sinorhizobium meliloti]QQF07162.1 hypothetical protein JFX10_27100 [Sinorhizobium meliloti]